MAITKSHDEYDGAMLAEPVLITDNAFLDYKEPLVSVLCITYNHEKYVEDCLAGILKQKTTFPVEVVVHDDASKDNTVRLVQKYSEKYPWVFTTVFQENNVLSRGQDPFYNALKAAKGRFIATCEGDDYWVDPMKLQKQIDCFQNNRACVLCGTRVYVKRDISATPYRIDPSVSPELLSEITADDIVFSNVSIRTVSRMSPRYIWEEYYDRLSKSPVSCDWLFVQFCVSKAKSNKRSIICIDDVCGCYRENMGGVWYSMGNNNKLKMDYNTLAFSLTNFDFNDNHRKGYESSLLSVAERLNLKTTGVPSVDKMLAIRKMYIWQILMKIKEQMAKYIR